MESVVLDRCPQCGHRLDLRLEPMQFEHGDTSEMPTVGFEVQSQICVNKECFKNEQVVNTIRHRRD